MPNDGGLEDVVRSYFTNLFKMNGIVDTSHVLSGVKRCITNSMNCELLAKFQAEDIYSAIKMMDPTKPSGEDSFPALFYQKYLHIVGKKVSAFCLDVLNGR